jgi:predicted 2-oxoglutarate/Fe(II)-dependent dioxygenase YbiX
MTPSPSLIGRGERGPDFALPRGNRDGPTRFYGLAGGRPVVLILTGGDGGAVADVVARLSAQHGDDLDVHVVARSATDAVGGAFHDPDAKVHEAYGATHDAPVAVVLDPNLRVVTSAPIRDVDTALATIGDAVPRSSPSDDIVAPRLAPVLFVPDALAAALRDELIERWSTEGSVETGVETVVEGERAEATDVRRKRRRDHTVTDRQLLRRLTQHIGARVFPELEKAFAFQAGAFEGFKIGCYTAEDRGHFEAHRDNLSAGTAHRRFGLTLNLNDDYAGGELRFPEYGPARYRPAAGEALVFSGSHLHEVLPVERGRRFVLLSFVLARGARVARPSGS